MNHDKELEELQNRIAFYDKLAKRMFILSGVYFAVATIIFIWKLT